MDILELAHEFGLEPQLSSSTNGGEYKSPCPACGGKDRFAIWPEKGRYWCRQCETKGDVIQFCCDFFNMTYLEACSKTGQTPKDSHYPKAYVKPSFVPKISQIPSETWQKRAQSFVMSAHQFALQHEECLRPFFERGLSQASVEKYMLGWQNSTQFETLTLWGLTKEIHKQKVWLPQGIVIPTFFKGALLKMKIRRAEWVLNDQYPKYAEVSGSIKTPSFYGSPANVPLLLLESELDAILVQQFASDLCCCVALGGCGKKPDIYADELFRQSSLILFSLDFDEAGIKKYQFWKSTYVQTRPWPTPREKSPGDAYLHGVDLRKWVLGGIQNYLVKNVSETKVHDIR